MGSKAGCGRILFSTRGLKTPLIGTQGRKDESCVGDLMCFILHNIVSFKLKQLCDRRWMPALDRHEPAPW
jgi:hypothetical protein